MRMPLMYICQVFYQFIHHGVLDAKQQSVTHYLDHEIDFPQYWSLRMQYNAGETGNISELLTQDLFCTQNDNA